MCIYDLLVVISDHKYILISISWVVRCLPGAYYFVIDLKKNNAEFNFFKVLSYALVFSLAVILKYHALLVLVMLFCVIEEEIKNFILKIVHNRYFVIKCLLFGIIVSVTLLLYLYIIHNSYGFWFTPDRYQQVHQINLQFSNFIANFIMYLGFLFLVNAPLFLYLPRYLELLKNNKLFIISSLIVSLLFVFFNIQFTGELNIGFLDKYIDKQYLSTLLVFFGLMGFLYFFAEYISFTNYYSDNYKKRNLCIALILFLVILSLTRPANRYLIFILPFFIMLVPSKIINSKIILKCYIIFCVGINIFAAIHQYCSGTAAQYMVEELRSRSILETTKSGAIESHVGDYFFKQLKNNKDVQYKYIVIAGSSKNAIFETRSSIGSYSKNYSLVKIS